jgi:hypothetical protein
MKKRSTPYHKTTCHSIQQQARKKKSTPITKQPAIRSNNKLGRRNPLLSQNNLQFVAIRLQQQAKKKKSTPTHTKQAAI